VMHSRAHVAASISIHRSGLIGVASISASERHSKGRCTVEQ